MPLYVLKILYVVGILPYVLIVFVVGIKLFIKGLPLLGKIDLDGSVCEIKKSIKKLPIHQRVHLFYVRMITEVGLIFMMCLCGKRYVSEKKLFIDKHLWRGNYVFLVLIAFIASLYAVPLSFIIK